MRRVIVVGCPGAGKSTFSRKLAGKTGLPLHYLDMIWHRPDRTVVSRDQFDEQLYKIMEEKEWILDGNYIRTLPARLLRCDTVFFFDLPLEECIEGVKSRLGMPRDDMPWSDDEIDPDFLQWVKDFPQNITPRIAALLAVSDKTVVRFKSRDEADTFIAQLK